MIFVVPISNLVFENGVEEINKILFVSYEYFMCREERFDEFEERVNSFYINNSSGILGHIFEYHKNDYFNENTSIALFEFDYSNDIESLSFDESNFLIKKVSKYVDDVLDFIRLKYCNISDKHSLPRKAGMYDNYYRAIGMYYCENNNINSISLNGNVCFTNNTVGIGMMIGDINTCDKLYENLFCGRNDEVYLNCRSAMKRVNEVLYFDNIDSVFVYIMSTIEMLSSNTNYIRFQDVKKDLCTFLAKKTSHYHELSAFYTNVSKVTRTEVVHNGKSLYELFDSENQIYNFLNKIIGHIVIYCENVINLNILTFEELDLKGVERRLELNVDNR